MQRLTAATIAALLGLALTASGTLTAKHQATAKPAPPKPAQPKPTTTAGATQAAPNYQVEVLWPKPLPNHWILGSVTGVTVDAQDHIWVLHTAASATPNSRAQSPTVARSTIHSLTASPRPGSTSTSSGSIGVPRM